MIYKKVKNINQTLEYTNKFVGFGHKTYKILKYIAENPDSTRQETMKALKFKSPVGAELGLKQFYILWKLGAVSVECIRYSKDKKGLKHPTYEYRITSYGEKVLKECESKYK